MKKTIFLLTVTLLALGVSAQRHQPQERPRHQEVTELVKDLTAKQKQQIESLTSESRKKVDAIRKEQQAVRDSIQQLIDSEGDHTLQLNPLFDREAKLQAQASREMYRTKVAVDRLLTMEQREQVRRSISQSRRPRGREKGGN